MKINVLVKGLEETQDRLVCKGFAKHVPYRAICVELLNRLEGSCHFDMFCKSWAQNVNICSYR